MGELKRTLGLGSLSFYGVGLILGAGIYSILGEAAGAAGSAVWMAFLVASLTAFLTGLSYAELSTMFPRAGAEYVYLREAWPKRRWLAGAIGWVLVASGTATASAVAIDFGGYAALFVDVAPWLVAGGLLVAMTLLNVVGVRESSWANVAFTLIEVAGLVLVVVLGARDPEFGRAFLVAPHMGVLGAAALIFFAYLGFEEIANLAEEAKHPARDLPRAIVIAMVVSTLLYVLVAAASVALASPDRLAQSDSPLATAVQGAAPSLVGALGGVALFATANTALISLMVASRMLFGMARDGDAPSPFGRTLESRGSPLVALAAVGGAAVVLLTIGGLAVVASVASVMALLAFGTVNLALIQLRRTRPDARRPFKVPLAVRDIPVLPTLGALAVALVLTQFEARVYLLSGVAIVLAVAAQLWRARRAGVDGARERRGQSG